MRTLLFLFATAAAIFTMAVVIANYGIRAGFWASGISVWTIIAMRELERSK